MFIVSMNVKIATGNAIRAIVEYMQTITAPDNYQLTKIMCMFSKDILRITVSHSDCLLVAGKKIIFEKFLTDAPPWLPRPENEVDYSQYGVQIR